MPTLVCGERYRASAARGCGAGHPLRRSPSRRHTACRSDRALPLQELALLLRLLQTRGAREPYPEHDIRCTCGGSSWSSNPRLLLKPSRCSTSSTSSSVSKPSASRGRPATKCALGSAPSSRAPCGPQAVSQRQASALHGYRVAHFKAPITACRNCPLGAQCLRHPERTVQRSICIIKGREGARNSDKKNGAIERMRCNRSGAGLHCDLTAGPPM